MLLVLVSWLVSAMMPESMMHSLLSGEGIRWLFSHSTTFLTTFPLVWLIFLSIAWGCFKDSTLHEVLMRVVRSQPLMYRDHISLWLVLFETVLFVAAMLALTVVPHAVLLSVTGSFFPSPFSVSIVPVFSVFICVISISYGLMSGRYHSVSDVFSSLYVGLQQASPLVIVYIFVVYLYYSVLFINGSII